MVRFSLVVAALLISSAVEARPRVYVTAPTSRTNAEIICPWVTGSVSPTWPQAQQAMMLGVCPPQATIR